MTLNWPGWQGKEGPRPFGSTQPASLRARLCWTHRKAELLPILSVRGLEFKGGTGVQINISK
jgi:hypothetical protein